MDGSARGERHFLIYNPPVVDPALGLRKSATQESIRLAGDLTGAERADRRLCPFAAQRGDPAEAIAGDAPQKGQPAALRGRG